VLHSNNTVVNSKSPAQRGEIILIYLSGAGTASGAAAAQATATASPSAMLEHPVEVFIGEEPAPILYQGLAPSTTSLYQLDVRIPLSVNPCGSTFRP
jgi:uncharacterized protein (TIGR03437 family)